ncbi:MAG: sigma-54 dependent transcriptional regulator [Thermodesulfobacteriota bacterium]
MARILIIDDDPLFCDLLLRQCARLGHEARCAHTLAEGFSQADRELPDVVFLDVMLPDGNGLQAIPRLRQLPSAPEVVIVTGAGDPDGAELAITSGAWDYVEKGDSFQAVVLALTRAVQYHLEKSAPSKTRLLEREGILGDSPPLRDCLRLLARAADSETNVLVTGETGTGKELFAWAVHRNSRRAKGNFVVVDCTALPETLVEGMLFGHRKGAFTGATEDRIGLVKQADGGTLFLDEVSEMPLSLQKTFLRALQERRFRPVGAEREVTSDFRLVAATNRDLDDLVRQGTFREDLLFRLRGFALHLPPLRERGADVRELARRHVARLCERDGLATKGFSPDFFPTLERHTWPGNVRELVQALERAVAAAGDPPTRIPVHLPPEVRVRAARAALTPKARSAPAQAPAPVVSNNGALPTLKEFRETTTAEYLSALVQTAGRDPRNACRVSGLSRSRLYELLQKHELSLGA